MYSNRLKMNGNHKLIVLVVFTIYKVVSSLPTLEVNANSGHLPISNDIYGINFANNDIDFCKEIKLPVDRWGGNAASRYNFKIDASNHANDWFFENQPEPDNKDPTKLPDGSHTDRFVADDKKIGARTIITVPMIGFVAKDREVRCGFSVKKYGEQEKTEPYHTDCGNGVKPDGKTLITGNDPLDTSIVVNASFAKEWVQYLTKKFGTADKGGVLYYQMDNEYDIWQSTHRDVRPKAVGTDEIIKLTEEYASAIKEVDPAALVLGPVGYGYPSLIATGLGEEDKKAHGNIDFAAFYLKTLKEYEDKYKKRLLDYLDCHVYPRTDSSLSGSDAKSNEIRLRSTRRLWDPTYVDESWIKDLGEKYNKVQFVPRMKNYVNQYYPGTKVAITEYNWGAGDTLNGGLVQADILGIFGREGVDLATIWIWPGVNASQPYAYAFRMFRNYDGKGSQFGDTSVTAISSDQQQIAIYASTRTSDKKMIIMVINKEPNTDIDTKIAINGFEHSGTAKVFTYSAANLQKIVESSLKVNDKEISYKFPGYSITLFELSPK